MRKFSQKERFVMENREKPTLVVMAAGMGSRFGGLKQASPVGPCGEWLMDYSVYDAICAGFGRVVFIIKHAIADTFRENIGRRLEAVLPVDYVYQELDALPEGFTVPEGRIKPWGTGHAVLCCRGVVDGAFAAVNADDYYGREAFEKLAAFLAEPQSDGLLHIAMAGYRLDNTLSESGHVSRGVCAVDGDGRLTGITERTRIERVDGTPAYTEDDGQTWTALSPDTVVSMNCWGFPAGALDAFDGYFRAFLAQHGGEQKSEFYLPFVVDSLMKEGKACVQVLHTGDKWYGMTYAEDREAVRQALADMTADGQYPEGLWK